MREHVQVLVVLGGPEITGRAATLAARYRLPTLVEQGTVARVDGLLAYGPNRPDLYRRAAYYVDRILKGAKPADLPIEQPTTFDFVDQPQDRPGPRPHHPPARAAPGHRGHPVMQ